MERDLSRIRNPFVSAGEKNIADAHDEMDGHCYERHFVEQRVASLPSQSVMFVDTALYHSRTKECL
jgi:hypothetical protein